MLARNISDEEFASFHLVVKRLHTEVKKHPLDVSRCPRSPRCRPTRGVRRLGATVFESQKGVRTREAAVVEWPNAEPLVYRGEQGRLADAHGPYRECDESVARSEDGICFV
jgi:hypothetical protein